MKGQLQDIITLCYSRQVKSKSYREPLTLIAHRGESGQFPENTLLAFDEAIKAGAGVVECDVHLSSDGDIVVIHDPTLDRTTDRTGRVALSPLSELRRAQAGYPKKFGDRYPELKIPTLREVLDCVSGRSKLLIEIKPEAVGTQSPSPLVVGVVKAIGERGMKDNVALISFHLGALGQARALSREIKTGILFHTWPPQDAESIADKVGAQFIILNKDLVLRAGKGFKPMGRPLGVYVVDDPSEIKPLYDRGVRAMATNCFGSLAKSLRAGGEVVLDDGGGFL